MQSNANGSSKAYLFVKRMLEGRVSPVSFLIVLGFFSSLVLLYISLHVYFFNVSNDIVTSRERLDYLMEQNVRLTARYNELAAPSRIIPMARELGMRAGSSDEVHRLALGRDGDAVRQSPTWAEARIEDIHTASPARDPRGR
jgi:cell division protein FtsL